MLEKLILDWKNWSKGAEKDENGWESDFSAWDDLIKAVCKSLMKKHSAKMKYLT